jgi:truncated hemoglobin YjbI
MMCMRQALTEQVSDNDLRAALTQAFAQMAEHMVNISAASSAQPTTSSVQP